MNKKRAWVWIGIALLVVAGGTGARARGQDRAALPGVITYQLPEGHLFRIAAQENAVPEDLSLALDKIAPATSDTPDEWLNISPDGQWLLLSTTRFDPACADWACLVLLPSDLSGHEVILSGGQPVHSESRGAVASGGSLIVYTAGDGPHKRDLMALMRGIRGAWGVPILLTGTSLYQWNDLPALSGDGGHVVFDCGSEPYGGAGTAICQVRTDGKEKEYGMMFMPQMTPEGVSPGTELHHPDYTPGGGLVFESDWGNSERLWFLAEGSRTPTLITTAFSDDNSPCVLPDGRIVSLWLGRPGNDPGYHEIKVMPPDGSAYQMVLTGVDVADVGLGCGAGQ